MAKRAKRNNPKNATFLNGYLIIPAVIQAIEKGNGNKAPTKIKIPPHFLEFLRLFSIFTSKYSLKESIFRVNFPKKYDNNPPK